VTNRSRDPAETPSDDAEAADLVTCPDCGAQLDATKAEELIRHALLHQAKKLH
jgi:hypothetical protein